MFLVGELVLTQRVLLAARVPVRGREAVVAVELNAQPAVHDAVGSQTWNS